MEGEALWRTKDWYTRGKGCGVRSLGCGDLCSSSKGLTKEDMTGLGGCFRLKMLWVCKAGVK